MRLTLILVLVLLMFGCTVTALDVNDHEGHWREIEAQKQKALRVSSSAARPVWNPPRLNSNP